MQQKLTLADRYYHVMGDENRRAPSTLKEEPISVKGHKWIFTLESNYGDMCLSESEGTADDDEVGIYHLVLPDHAVVEEGRVGDDRCLRIALSTKGRS
jgi:hypothetical protein